MDKVFLTILNMSLTGSFVILVICLARLLLKKAPKIVSYCLWAAAGFRLVFPFSIESMFSLIPFRSQTIPQDIAMQPVPRIDSGMEVIDTIVSGVLPTAAPHASVSPLQIWTSAGLQLWFFGVLFMIVYGIASYLIVKRRMRGSVCTDSRVFENENIKSPFVLGVISPKIYIPAGLSRDERECIILHERTHIRRHDHIIKFVVYFILCLHWFNPLVWVAFLLMGVDMEMSCDEYVLKELGGEVKKNYSMSLLALATDRVIGSSPLAFGEDGVKMRIKNVLKFRKPSRTVFSLAIAFVTVLSMGLMLSRVTSADLNDTPVMENRLFEPDGALGQRFDAAESGDDDEHSPDTTQSGGDSANQPDTTETDGDSEHSPDTTQSGHVNMNSPVTIDPRNVSDNNPETTVPNGDNDRNNESTESDNSNDNGSDIIEPGSGNENTADTTQSGSISEVPDATQPGTSDDGVPDTVESGSSGWQTPIIIEPDNNNGHENNPGTSEPGGGGSSGGGSGSGSGDGSGSSDGGSDGSGDGGSDSGGGGSNTGRTYVITNYYDENGRFSDLGHALGEHNSEKVLTVSSGDIIIVGGRQYRVVVETLTLTYYTQPSLDMVIRWWTDYLNSLAQSGIVTVVN